MKRIIFIGLLFLCFTIEAQSFKKLTFSGTNQIIINNNSFPNKTIEFTDGKGAWFTKTDDAHARIIVNGMLNGKAISMDMEIDGKSDNYVLTCDANDQFTPFHTQFYIFISKDENSQFICKPENGENISIQISSFNNENFICKISGTVTYNDPDNPSGAYPKLQITGELNIKLPSGNSSKSVSNSSGQTFSDCDNTVYDKLVGAEDRSPTDCEKKLDKKIRDELRDAFANVNNIGSSWTVTNETPDKEIIGIARGADKEFYDYINSDVGQYSIMLSLDPKSQEYQALRQKMNTISTGANASNMSKIQDSINTLMQGMQLKITVGINHSSGLTNYGENFGNIFINGIDNAIRVNGSSMNGSSPETVLYLGNWKSAVIKKESDGSSKLNKDPAYPKEAKYLSVQCIYIEIIGLPSDADAAIKYIDFSKLRELINFVP